MSSNGTGDSPTVDWFDIQPKLKNSQGDVLVLLDCCHGAQAARGRLKLPIRVELLAACPMDSLTPGPGPRSFTTALMREIKNHLDTDGFIFMDQLHSSLAARDRRLFATPFYSKLGVGGRRSIRLEPLLDGSTPVDLDAESVIHLSVSARGFLATEDLDSIAQWLNNDTPRFVSALEVEKVVLTTKQLQSIIDTSNENTGARPVLSVLDDNSQTDILTAWNRIMDLVAAYEPVWSGSSPTRINDSLSILEDRATTFLKQLQLRNAFVEANFERGLLESTSLDDKAILNKTLNNNSVQAFSFSEVLELRRIIKFPPQITESLEISYTESECFHGKPEVIHEYKWYQGDLSADEISALRQRVMLLTKLLNFGKSSEYASLECLHWFHNSERQHFGLIFNIPQVYLSSSQPQYVSLAEAIKNPKTRPTLGERFKIAILLAQAVAKWHSTGWVHQSVASHDIIFFCNPSENRIDYAAPFLAGFEFSRPVADRSLGRYVERKYLDRDIYRHPDRLGASQKTHTKEHDIYSLGVVLLEIGLWQVAPDMISSAMKTELTPASMRTHLKKNASHRLAHYAGKGYERAVSICLAGNFGVNMDNREQSRLRQEFQARVVDELKIGSTLE